MATDKPQKLKIGWFSFSCCEDNTIVMTEVMNDHWQEWKELFDFRHARVLKSNNIMDDFDFAFIEGAMAGPEHVEKVKDIQEVVNYRRALTLATNALTARPLNLSLIRQMHGALMNSVRGTASAPGP